MEVWLDAYICADSSPNSAERWVIFRSMKPIVRCLRLFTGSENLSGSFSGSFPGSLPESFVDRSGC